MYLLSIDIGIKNLAHCLFHVDSKIEIVEWGVVNLTKPPKLCQCGTKICGKHSKKCGFPLPQKELLHLSSKTLLQLQSLCTKYDIKYEKDHKHELLEKLRTYQQTCLLVIPKENTKEYTSVDLGISLKKQYDILFQSYSIDQVVVENQIGPLASKMKCMQGMVIQYWIMKGVEKIHGVSSCHKLNFINASVTTYAERKKESVKHTKNMITSCEWTTWIQVFSSHPKKDDLADTFLQGLWFLDSIGHSSLSILKQKLVED